jgi:site-specific DNA-methyltransferase (adenine-specific)
MTNKLYYGDNVSVLRESIASESVDLIYLDPPFNSNASYNVLFKAPSGEQSQAQIEAFEDTWHWNESAARAFDEVLTGPLVRVALPHVRYLAALIVFFISSTSMGYVLEFLERMVMEIPRSNNSLRA